MRPDAERFRDPDQARWNPYLGARRVRADRAGVAVAVSESRAAQRAEPVVRRSEPSSREILKLKSDLATLRVQHAVIKHEIAIRRARGLPPLRESDAGWQLLLKGLARFKEACRKAGFDPNQPRDERGRWTDGGGSDRPEIPEKKPATARLRNRVVKEVAKWLAKVAAKELTGPIGIFLNVAEAASWLYEAYPYVRAYLDPPKSLDELQQAVQTPEIGYNIHHVNEQTPAEQDGYSRWMIDGPENLVRIPTLKHWEITGWYMAPNEDYGGLSPRAYLRGRAGRNAGGSVLRH